MEGHALPHGHGPQRMAFEPRLYGQPVVLLPLGRPFGPDSRNGEAPLVHRLSQGAGFVGRSGQPDSLGHLLPDLQMEAGFVVHERHQTDPESPPEEHDLVGGGSERPTVRQFALAGLHLLQVQHQTPDLPRAPVWFGRLRKHVRADGQRRKQGFRAFDRIRQDMEGLRVELQPHAQPQQEQGRRADEQLLRPADGQILYAQGV